MGPVRVVIAEDDPEQAAGIAALMAQLRSHWPVDLLVHDRAGLARALDEVVPDILLLDLHMPGEEEAETSVLEMARGCAVPPIVILITGDPSQALAAFDSAVADYIVKPVKPARLAQALQRAEGLLYSRRAMVNGVSLLASASPAGPAQWLSGTRGRDIVMIDPSDILFLQAERKYTTAMLPTGQVLIRHGISEIEGFLDINQFIRIHRSTVVNIKRIDFLRRDEMGRLRLHMKGRHDSLIVSRSFEHMFKGV